MTANANLLCDIDCYNNNNKKVNMRNKMLVDIKGEGNIIVETKNGKTFIKNLCWFQMNLD